MTSDSDLLQEYVRTGSEESFRALIERHPNLVYSAALRQVRSREAAEEVVQSVFTDLARSAARLAPGTILQAWLYQVTRRTAIDVVRKETRRQRREQAAQELIAMNAATADWTHIEPMLDEAMHSLEDTERAAVLLRYFENKSLRDVGQALGTSEDAAQKRVSRAVDRLREFFASRGVTAGAGGLAALISVNAIQAAPAGLVAGICAAAGLAGTAGVAGASATAIKIITMNTLQKVMIGVVLAGAAGTAIYEARQASTLRGQNKLLQEQQTPLAEQVRQLALERDDATNRLAAVLEENARLKSNAAEVARLRGRVAGLQRDLKGAARATSTTGEGEDARTAPDPSSVLGRISLLKRALKDRPQMRIPEIQMLTDNDWLTLMQRGPWGMANLETEDGMRRALAQVRDTAKMKFASRLSRAVDGYAKANDGQLPTEMSQLRPYLDAQTVPFDPERFRFGMARGNGPPPDPTSQPPYPPVDDATLQRYRIIQAGTVADLRPGQPVIAETAPVDEQYDTLYRVGLSGFIKSGTGKNSGFGWSGTPDLESMTPQERESYDRSRKQIEESKQRMEDLRRANQGPGAPGVAPQPGPGP